MDDGLPDPLPGEAAGEVVRATADLAPIAESVMLVMFPGARLFKTGDAPLSLMLEPAPDRAGLARLKDKLFELVDRPEWRRRHAIAREVTDRHGTRLEVMTPQDPNAYVGGPRIVGPFSTQERAEGWGGDHAVSTLSFDTFFTGDAWLVDLFDLPDAGPHGIS